MQPAAIIVALPPGRRRPHSPRLCPALALKRRQALTFLATIENDARTGNRWWVFDSALLAICRTVLSDQLLTGDR